MMTAAAVTEAMIERIMTQIITIAKGLALEATHYVLGPSVLTVPLARAADLPLSQAVQVS
mgnify:CR=1 FL=1